MINPAFSLGQRERWLMRYVAALDSGDEWTLQTIGERALDDAELSRLIDGVHDALNEEQGLEIATQMARARQLARHHLTPEIMADAEPSNVVRVAEVAGQLLAGANEEESAALQPFLASRLPIPARLSRANLQGLARELAVAVDEKFFGRFKDAAITLRMKRTTPQSQLALAREEKTRRVGRSTIIQSELPREERQQRAGENAHLADTNSESAKSENAEYESQNSENIKSENSKSDSVGSELTDEKQEQRADESSNFASLNSALEVPADE